MEKQRREKALVVVVLLVVIAGLTVAFAALSTTLNINGTAYLDAAKWGIKFENLSSPTRIGKATTTGTAKIEETKSAEITGINVSLSTPGDKVTYTVDLVNKGTINAKIDKIEKTALTEEQQKYLTFKVTDKNGYEIKQGDILEKGETKKITITIEFKKDLTKEDLPKQTSTISLSYKLNFVQTDEKKDTTSSEVQNELPSGYKKVGYLESVNGSYLLIPNMITEDSIITTKIQIMKADCSFVFGYTYDGYKTGIQLRPQNNNFEGRWGNEDWREYTPFSIQKIYNLTFENGALILNDISYPFDKKNGYIVSSLDIGIFARNVSGKIEYAIGGIRMYSFKIDNYINLIPCLDSDNKPCMYDTVSKKTFYNNGTGEFLYGNVID